jgi:hypothetical protein
VANEVADRAVLATRACGDIPPQFCTVIDVEISGDTAMVWLLTNDVSHFESYQVNFIRQDGAWIESLSSVGFQTGTPEHVRQRAERIEAGVDRLQTRRFGGRAIPALQDLCT